MNDLISGTLVSLFSIKISVTSFSLRKHTMASQAYFLFLLAFLLPFSSTLDVTNICPEKCSCSFNNGISVSCRDQYFSKIPYSNFSIRVELLDMSYNPLSVLHNNSFSRYPNLKSLYLHYARITEIEVHTFKGLHSLRKVDLSNNCITYIDPNSFMDSNNLEIIVLTNNEIKVSLQEPILVAPSLTRLDLRECKLAKLSYELFSGMLGLKTLDISSNKLTDLSSDIFKDHSNLIVVEVGGNNWKCNDNFRQLMCWVSSRRNLHEGGTKSHRPVHCNDMMNGGQKQWTVSKDYKQCSQYTHMTGKSSTETDITIPHYPDTANKPIFMRPLNTDTTISPASSDPHNSDATNLIVSMEPHNKDTSISPANNLHVTNKPAYTTSHKPDSTDTDNVSTMTTTKHDPIAQDDSYNWWFAKKFSIVEIITLVGMLIISIVSAILVSKCIIKKINLRKPKSHAYQEISPSPA